MLRDEGVAELLPSANTVIFDEAHQLPDVAGLFLVKMFPPASSLNWRVIVRLRI